MQAQQPVNLIEEIALRGAVWALIGAIFGSMFVLLAEWFDGRLLAPVDVVVATVGAAALTSLFYGSMRLTVMVANFTFIAMLVYTWQAPTALDLSALVFIGAGVGTAVGAAYGLKDKRSRVFCAEAKIIAGAVAGLGTGVLALVLHLLVDGIEYSMLAMIVAPLGVLAYIMLSGWFIARCHRLLPPFVDGTVVGLGVGSVTGLMFLIMAGTLDGALLGSAELRDFVTRVEESWGLTMVACAATCVPVGVARAVFKVPWYNR